MRAVEMWTIIIRIINSKITQNKALKITRFLLFVGLSLRTLLLYCIHFGICLVFNGQLSYFILVTWITKIQKNLKSANCTALSRSHSNNTFLAHTFTDKALNCSGIRHNEYANFRSDRPFNISLLNFRFSILIQNLHNFNAQLHVQRLFEQ